MQVQTSSKTTLADNSPKKVFIERILFNISQFIDASSYYSRRQIRCRSLTERTSKKCKTFLFHLFVAGICVNIMFFSLFVAFKDCPQGEGASKAWAKRSAGN
jgi:hypothetical protein